MYTKVSKLKRYTQITY